MLSCLALQSISQDLPKLSPLSKSDYVVGLTRISLQYSRPSVRGRVIFGDLVPYDKVWRLGANEPTKITTSTDVNFASNDGKVYLLPAGTYAIFAFPSANGNWKIVFNSDTEQWGAGNYEADKDVITLNLDAMPHEFTETLFIDINDISLTGASIVICWEKIKVVIPFKVDTYALAERNIEQAISEGKDLDKVYYGAANYYFNMINDLEKALEYINLSIGVAKTHTSVFLKARILHAKGETKEAIKLAEEAKKMAEEAKQERWVNYIQESLDEWSK